IRTTATFGPYERLIFSNIHKRPFETCPGIEALHGAAIDRVEQALPAIEASSHVAPIRLLRLIRGFNRESQTFYFSACPDQWTYYYSYVDYQSWLAKVAPMIWVVEVLHRSEIYVVALLIVGSWAGIFGLYWTSKRLTNSVVV